MVIQFPNEMERYEARSIREVAKSCGWDAGRMVGRFIVNGCRRSDLNDAYERARRQRMNQGHGPKGVA